MKFGVIFDMDGVIVDSNPYHKKALITFCKKYGFDLTEEELKNKIYGRTNKDWIKTLFPSITEEDIKKHADEKEQLFRDLYKDDIVAVKGIEHFLLQLQQEGIPFAIGTSAPQANVSFTLNKTGLIRYFPIILDDSFVKHGKPHPDIYIKCAQALGLSPQKCVVIEDSFSGIESGKRAGAKVIGITTTHSREELSECDLIIDHFNQLSVKDIASLLLQD